MIDANQAGTADYTAAPQVTGTIIVNQAPAFVIGSSRQPGAGQERQPGTGGGPPGGTTISLHIYGTDISRIGSSVRREYHLPIRPE